MALLFEARHRYAASRDGRRLGPWEAGEVVAVEAGDLAWLLADSPGLFDPAAPVSPQRAQDLAAAQERRRQEAARLQGERDAAIREHVAAERGGPPMCRLRDGRWHLLGDIVAEPDGSDGWLVGCGEHVAWRAAEKEAGA